MKINFTSQCDTESCAMYLEDRSYSVCMDEKSIFTDSIDDADLLIIKTAFGAEIESEK